MSSTVLYIFIWGLWMGLGGWKERDDWSAYTRGADYWFLSLLFSSFIYLLSPFSFLIVFLFSFLGRSISMILCFNFVYLTLPFALRERSIGWGCDDTWGLFSFPFLSFFFQYSRLKKWMWWSIFILLFKRYYAWVQQIRVVWLMSRVIHILII